MNMHSLIPFSFEGQSFRVFDQNGEPSFVLADICKVLDISNVGNAAARLDDDEKSSIRNPDVTSAGGNPNLTIINESGFWSLVLNSRKPEAKRLKKWVTSEVIPAIRKTGGYMMAAQDETPEQLAVRALQVLQATVERQKEQLAKAQPKVDALDRLESSEGSVVPRLAAKMLDLPERKFTKWLETNHWAFRQNGIGPLQAYKDKRDARYLDHRPHTFFDQTRGEDRTVTQLTVTPKGLAKLATIFGRGQGGLI